MSGQPAPQSGATLRVVCCYCRDVIAEGEPGSAVSHGVCDPCFRRELDAIEAPAR